MESVFTGDVSLHLGLVDPVDGGPRESPSDDNGPERVSLQRVRIKTERIRKGKQRQIVARDKRKCS